MMRLRRASAIVALSLLTSAATAYAECAWVVWEQTNTESPRPVTDHLGRLLFVTLEAARVGALLVRVVAFG